MLFISIIISIIAIICSLRGLYISKRLKKQADKFLKEEWVPLKQDVTGVVRKFWLGMPSIYTCTSLRTLIRKLYDYFNLELVEDTQKLSIRKKLRRK